MSDAQLVDISRIDFPGRLQGVNMHHVIRRCADVMDYKVTHNI